MRLCFVVEGTTDIRMAEGLASRTDLTILGRTGRKEALINHPPATPLHVETSTRSRLGFALFLWQYLRRRRGDFDRVIVQGYGLAALAANLACRSTGTPVYMLVCSPVEAYYLCRRGFANSEKPFRRHELWLLSIIARLNAHFGGRYIALSRHLEQVIREHRRQASVFVIPVYGVDTERFAPALKDKARLRTEIGLPQTGSLVFFSSRIAPEKDSETLLAAVKKLREEGRDLWLLNRSGRHQAMQEAAQRYGIQDRVITTDAVHPQNVLPLSYQAADLCVQASREEGLGFSPLEALACGVPVVAADVGGLRETIIDGETGWTYPVGDWEALADRMKAALDDPAEASRRALAGRAVVCAEYDSCVAFDRLMTVLERP